MAKTVLVTGGRGLVGSAIKALKNDYKELNFIFTGRQAHDLTCESDVKALFEEVKPDLDILDTYVKATYPDLRKCINMVQMNSVNGALVPPEKSDAGDSDYKLEMTELFKAGKISQARKLVCSQARPEEIEDVYKWLYDNIDLFGDEEKQETAILIIKQGLVDHTLVSDPEINLAATMIRLARMK